MDVTGIELMTSCLPISVAASRLFGINNLQSVRFGLFGVIWAVSDNFVYDSCTIQEHCNLHQSRAVVSMVVWPMTSQDARASRCDPSGRPLFFDRRFAETRRGEIQKIPSLAFSEGGRPGCDA